MREMFIGEAIRQKRLEFGLTQEQLCEGLPCEPSTLSRIETGKQTPSRNLSNILLQRLGLPHDRYYALFTSSEAEAESLRTAIDRCAARFCQTLGEEKRQARLDSLEYLNKLGAITEANDNIGRQYLLAMRVILGEEDRPYPFDIKLKMLLEAIRLTVPQFSLETLGAQLYSIEEMEIISQIAGAYSEAGQHEKAAGIFYQLLTYVQRHYQGVTRTSRYLSPAILHYARELCLIGRYKEALENAELGQSTCLNFGYCQPLPGLLAVMAECWCGMGDFERGKALYCQAYYLYKVTGDANGLAGVEESARHWLGSEFRFQGVLL